MSHSFKYQYARKALSNGSYVSNTSGTLSLDASVRAELPGKDFRCHAGGALVDVSFDVELSAGEKTSLDTAHGNWDPESTLLTLQFVRIRALAAETGAYITAGVNPDRKIGLLMLSMMATEDGLVNRKAHIRTLMDWAATVSQEYRAQRAAVLAATTPASVASVSLNLSQFEATLPVVTMITALDIAD